MIEHHFFIYDLSDYVTRLFALVFEILLGQIHLIVWFDNYVHNFQAVAQIFPSLWFLKLQENVINLIEGKLRNLVVFEFPRVYLSFLVDNDVAIVVLLLDSFELYHGVG